MARQPTSRQLVRQILNLYREGFGVRSITRITDVPESTVTRILRGQHRYNRNRVMSGKRPGKELAIYQ